MDLQKRLKNRVSGDSPRAVLTKNWHALAVGALFLFALWIRLIPRKGMQYLQALDPYMIARMSQAIITEGHLPAMDAWRYFPFVTPTYQLTLGNIYIPAYLYKVVGGAGMDFIAYAQSVPAVFGAAMVVVMYFIGKEAFDRNVGVAAAFFLASSAAVLHRSSAGWYEKEPIGGLLMLLTIYFFLRGWTRSSWPSGIMAGLALGLAKPSWGGTSYLHLLLPFVVFVVLFIDEDVRNLVAAYTPTILLGHFLAVVFNPARHRITSIYALGGFGVLALLWLRYAVEEYDLVADRHLSKVVPTASVTGFFLLALSPLYSQWVASRFFKIFDIVATGGPYGTIGTTVAENAPARFGQLVSQLGAAGASGVLPQYLTPLIRITGGWTFGLIGLTMLTVVMTLMLLRKYFAVDDIPARVMYGTVPALLFLAAMAGFVLQTQWAMSLLFAFLVAFIGAVFLSLYPRGPISVRSQWPVLLLFLWAGTAIYGVTQRSRLMFLAAQPVALMAGYAVAKGVTELYRADIWDAAADRAEAVDVQRLVVVGILIVAGPVVVINAASAFNMASQVGGSPNQLWMENLDYMRTETPVDSVVLSWWDYGYWFESLGGRAAVADGGNMAFYRSDTFDKINFPLADFLTAENHTKHLSWLDSLSVDYVVLDSTMIGKYSAVSTIHKRGGQPNAMQTFSCQTRRANVRGQSVQVCERRQARNNKTYMLYSGRGARFLVPIGAQDRNPSARLPGGAPVFQGQRGSAAISRFCSEQGIIEFETPENQSTLPGCLAWHPYRGHRSIVYIPQPVMRSTLVQLYIMDGYNMPRFEKVPGGSNGYVKMWRYTGQ